MNAAEPRGLRELQRALTVNGMPALADVLRDTVPRIERDNKHGDQAAWRSIVDDLPAIDASSCDFNAPAVRIGEANDCDDEARARLRRLLLRLKPWRKGPFDVFGVRIDSEWRADWKWARLADAIGDLRGRRVLDVGCGNGYYLWRMLGGGAALALGIDPGRLFAAQFDALKRYRPDAPAFVLQMTDEQFPVGDGDGAGDGDGGDGDRGDGAGAGIDSVGDSDGDNGFDTVFSMGVLYHRRDPRAHLRRLLAFARPGGEVVVESLVSDGGADDVLAPPSRYAKMRNVHAIPSAPALEKWLRAAGAADIRLLDITATTPAEQRATEWMTFESLADFLAPGRPHLTIEGHPAPKRAVFLCRRPN
ncbi:MAG: DUF1698 domain-containing protein [Gammaproteobacteria bacterium]|nr:DUF1698 domain-containing protein [Gammaproteobacteria bacterium]